MTTITAADITVDDFKTFFVRDFDYAIAAGQTTSIYSCQTDHVMDADITRAFTEAKSCFNDCIWDTDDNLKTAFLYLAAHNLVYDLQTSIQGASASASYAVNSKSVGPVSESYAIPEWMLQDPILGPYATTRYGQKYIALLKPLLIGNVVVHHGHTTPW